MALKHKVYFSDAIWDKVTQMLKDRLEDKPQQLIQNWVIYCINNNIDPTAQVQAVPTARDRKKITNTKPRKEKVYRKIFYINNDAVCCVYEKADRDLFFDLVRVRLLAGIRTSAVDIMQDNLRCVLLEEDEEPAYEGDDLRAILEEIDRIVHQFKTEPFSMQSRPALKSYCEPYDLPILGEDVIK